MSRKSSKASFGAAGDNLAVAVEPDNGMKRASKRVNALDGVNKHKSVVSEQLSVNSEQLPIHGGIARARGRKLGIDRPKTHW